VGLYDIWSARRTKGVPGVTHNIMKRFGKIFFTYNRFPGVWWDFFYNDRRLEECCKVVGVELTIFTLYFAIEWYPPHKEKQ